MVEKILKDWTVSEVCKIISKCKAHGVLEISVAGLSMKFQPVGQPAVTAPSQDVSHRTGASNPYPEDKQVAELANQQALEDAEEAQMLIENPFAYERAHMLNDLERNRVQDAEA